MAPIDPNQLLAAFSPLLTPKGGIKNANEVPRLSSLMKKFSRKLVSRCVYCNVLLATNIDVLDEFLKSGGWETIHQWIKSANESTNTAFLSQLLKLLLILPMTVERLKENDTPKLIRKLAKSSDASVVNTTLASQAKEVVEKWTRMIELAAGSVEKKDHKDKDHRKKRKKESVMSDATTNSDNSKDGVMPAIKKTKIKSEISVLKANSNSVTIDLNNRESVVQLKSESSFKDNKDSVIDRIARPSTVKIKPGKSRLEGLVTNMSTTGSPRKSKKSTDSSSKRQSTSKSLTIASNKAVSGSAESPTPSSTVIVSSTATTATTAKAKPLPDVTKPTTPQPLVQTTPAKTYTLQDSTSFMDALIAPQIQASQIKKKRRSSSSTTPKDSKDSNSGDSPSSSPPKISFYKETVDEKLEASATGDNSANSSIDNEDSIDKLSDSNDNNKEKLDINVSDEQLSHMNIDLNVADIGKEAMTGLSISRLSANISIDETSSSPKIKSILMLVKRGTKKSVRWLEESKLEQIKYFELDETERVNVTRPAGVFSDLKRSDMKHEAELMLMARRSAYNFDIADDTPSRTQTKAPWKLIPCPLIPTLVELGKDSSEKYVQAERLRTVLEAFYTRDQIPDSPREPEMDVNAAEFEAPKVMPLEDENNPNNVHDFSNIDLPQPKTGEVLPSRASSDFAGVSLSTTPQSSALGFGRHAINSNTIGNYSTQAPPMLSNFGPPMMSPFGGPLLPAPDPYAVRAVQPSGLPFYPSNGGPPMQSWSEVPPLSSAPHFVPPFTTQPPPRIAIPMNASRPARPHPRNAQNTVCRHFARTGKCKFQPRCSFLHSRETDKS